MSVGVCLCLWGSVCVCGGLSGGRGGGGGGVCGSVLEGGGGGCSPPGGTAMPALHISEARPQVHLVTWGLI